MPTVRVIRFLVILLILANSASVSQDRGFGLGIIVGEPTGVSMKGWLTATTAVDGGLAWSFVKGTSFHIHADYPSKVSGFFVAQPIHSADFCNGCLF